MKLFQKNKEKTEKKEKALKPLSGYVNIIGFYPEIEVLKTTKGYVRMYELADVEGISKNHYDNALLSMLPITRYDGEEYHLKSKPIIQIYTSEGRAYLILVLDTVLVDDAIAIFNEIKLQVVTVHEWLQVIKNYCQNSTDELVIDDYKKAMKVISKISPYPSRKKDEKIKHTEMLYLNDTYIQMLTIDNIPMHLTTSFATRIMKLADISVFINRIDNDICKEALDKYEVNISDQKKEQMYVHLENEDLFNICFFIRITSQSKVELEKKRKNLEHMCSQFGVSINPLHFQQTKVYKAFMPLGDNCLLMYKAFTFDRLLSFMPHSWTSHHMRDICYGLDSYGQKIEYSRVDTRESGFILSSDKDIVYEIIEKEVDRILEKGLTAEIYTISSDIGALKKYSSVNDMSSILCGDMDIDREILRRVVKNAYGKEGILKSDYAQILNNALKTIDKMDLRALKEELKINGQPLYKSIQRMKELYRADDGYVCERAIVHICGDSKQNMYEKVAIMLSSIARSEADFVYILNGEQLAGVDIYKLYIQKSSVNTKNRCISVSSIVDNKRMFTSTALAKDIVSADFLNIGYLDAVDRIALYNIMHLSKDEKNAISNTDMDTGVIRLCDLMLTYTKGE